MKPSKIDWEFHAIVPIDIEDLEEVYTDIGATWEQSAMASYFDKLGLLEEYYEKSK